MDEIPAGTALIQTMGGLFAGVETTLADEAGDDAGLDRRDMAPAIAPADQMIGQAIQRVKRRRAAIRPTRAVKHAGVPIQETRDESATLIFRADAARTGEQLIVGFQYF
ncbi:MAG: hypothetical protein RKO25_01825 [Candidatus Contendobacter sp.]|nr:hypothetical protein [Candidatus Contendobacter sp.]